MKTPPPWRPPHVHFLFGVHSWSHCVFRDPGPVTTDAQTVALFCLARQTTNWLTVGHFLLGFPPCFNREENRWGENGNSETWQRDVNFPPPGFFCSKDFSLMVWCSHCFLSGRKKGILDLGPWRKKIGKGGGIGAKIKGWILLFSVHLFVRYFYSLDWPPYDK